jgi:hypothetical protein
MAAGRPYLYLAYVVGQIACDFSSQAREFVAHACMRGRIILLIETHKVISIFSVIRDHGEIYRLSMDYITTIGTGADLEVKRPGLVETSKFAATSPRSHRVFGPHGNDRHSLDPDTDQKST